MKFSVFTDMLGFETFSDALKAAAELGFSSIDLRAKLDGDTIDTISLEKAKELKTQIDQHGLQVSSVSSWAVNSCAFSGPPKYDSHDEGHHRQMTEVLDRLFDLADIFDAPHVRVYSLHRPEGFDQWTDEQKEAEYRYNASIMRRHAEHAERRGKMLLVENEPPTMSCNAKELGLLIRYADHPGLKINWDILNGWRAGEYPTEEAYEHVKEYVWQTHIKGAYRKADSATDDNPFGEFGNFAIPGQDDYDHKPVMSAIAKHDPQAVMTIDPHYPSLDEKDKLGEVEVMRRSKRFFESITAD
ncbi:sugar phosphate isomerase/epimerase family protein [Paenibacillus rhizophilus]|uniref:Sugar phosphate isomerase/epimerase n=1 Tax=Paenibacillus rhizophilus TaxID=1850366 RepID=A0A3N9Q0H9_9BACL|nr:sugar phosphate isomerase/epimerase [Paenibacillus rhizophilus]RQW12182.1 sugar phosphate isomerase/epimerase [Paenibacillus rhizophilus]